MRSTTGSAAISLASKVSYRDSRRCSGATFPVRFWNRQGGSASRVENCCPASSLNIRRTVPPGACGGVDRRFREKFAEVVDPGDRRS
jgi:hypothetical protein